jgi:hypothetical protein
VQEYLRDQFDCGTTRVRYARPPPHGPRRGDETVDKTAKRLVNEGQVVIDDMLANPQNGKHLAKIPEQQRQYRILNVESVNCLILDIAQDDQEGTGDEIVAEEGNTTTLVTMSDRDTKNPESTIATIESKGKAKSSSPVLSLME